MKNYINHCYYVIFILLGCLSFSYADTIYVDNTIADINVASDTPDCTDYDAMTFSCGLGTGIVYASLADVNNTILVP
jgi:hypothetical protein